MKTLAALALLLLLTACSHEPSPRPTAAPSSTPTAAPTRTTPQEVVEDPEARLYSVGVERRGDGLRVTTWWSLDEGRRGALAVSDDGFRTATYRAWRPGSPTGSTKPPRRSREPVPVFRDAGLLQQPTTSLQEGVSAVVAGGDGATLFPFTHTARSADGGGSWRTYDVAQVDSETGFTSGAVVLSDGRLLALVDHWSGDRRNRPSAPHHGLWISAGDDWSTYLPHQRRLRPRPQPAPGGWSPLVTLQAADGVVWSTTWDDGLYVSTDGAETFAKVPTR